MKWFIRITAFAAVLFIAVLLIAGVASAQIFPSGPEPGPETPGATAITSGPGDKMYPAVAGDIIVWLDNTTWSVQVYNVTSGESLTIPGEGIYAVVSMRQVDVSGDHVVWTGVSAATGACDIYLYDIAEDSVTPLTSDPAIQMFPSISDDLVFWMNVEETTGMSEIYWYNIGNGYHSSYLEDPSINRIFPTIGGETLAWFDDDGDVSGHLNLNWFAESIGERAVFESSTNPSSPPAVSSDGRLITWVAEVNGSLILLMMDISNREERVITGEEALPTNPAIDGNYIVWADYRNGNGDIYLYDIQSGQERQITSDNAEQIFPDISGDRIVWMANNDGYWNIYLATADGPATMPIPAPTGEAESTSPPIKVSSSIFSSGTSIPVRHTCDGDDASPPLSWSGVPEGAKSLALIVDDPDAPKGSFTHWVIYNISPEESGLVEGLPHERDLPGGLHQGLSDFGTIGYGGPCPPPGPAHHYIFHLYALNRIPDLPGGADRAALEAEMQGSIIAEGVLVGTYGR